jgi:CBS domain-containing protein
MPILELQRSVTAHADLVWGIVADLGGEPGVPPAAKRVEMLDAQGPGARRRVIGNDGFAWLEECVVWEDQHQYTMSVEASDFPVAVKALRYTCVIRAKGDIIKLRLYFDYLPRFGALGALLDRFGSRRRLAAYGHQVLDNWVRIIHAREWAYRVTVASLLDEKGREVFSVSPATSVVDAAALLREHGIGSVIVLDQEQAIVGLVSERDIVRGLAEKGSQLMQEPVHSIMTHKVIIANSSDNMMLVMACMSERRIRHLPVVEEGRLIGVISIGDVVKARISELEGQSETLRDYIEARRWHELYREIGSAAYSGDLQEQV